MCSWTLAVKMWSSGGKEIREEHKLAEMFTDSKQSFNGWAWNRFANRETTGFAGFELIILVRGGDRGGFHIGVRGDNWGQVMFIWDTMCLYAPTLTTPRTIVHQTLSMGFSRQEYWSGFPFSSSGDLSIPRIEPMSRASPALQVDSFTHWAVGEVYKRY